jgi:GNAT superfamily N-acetyltransferase
VHPVTVERILDLPSCGLVELLQESQTSGLQLVQRLVDDWHSGENRFDRPGEALFAAVAGERVIGVCGLNRDPYATRAGVGRVRHLYVLAQFRRHGVGRRLVGEVEHFARPHFNLLRLRTDSSSAARFYVALGFQPVCGVEACTHQLVLTAQ